MGVGVLGAPDPAPEAVTNYYITRPPPPPGTQPEKFIVVSALCFCLSCCLLLV